MRWLIALGLAIACAAGTAQAQTSIVCKGSNDAWAQVSGGTDVTAMKRVIATIKSICPVKLEAERRLAAVIAKQRQDAVRQTEIQSTAADDSAFAEAKAANTVDAYDQYLDAFPTGRHVHDATAAQEALAAPPPAVTAPAPGPPVDPCSQEAVDQRDPSLPAGGPDPAWPARSRSSYAARYAARAEAFKAEALRCGTMPAALANYGYAVSLGADAGVLKARAELFFDMSNYQGAIGDYSAAISILTPQGSDQTLLGLYAARAMAYSKVGMHKEEIADLGQVVDKMGELNAGDRSQLLDSAVYKERLARAYYSDGDIDDADQEFGYVEPAFLDWQDDYFIGSIAAQKKMWDKAILFLGKAKDRLAGQVTGASLQAARTPIELALGKAYAARGGDLDARNAWDSFQAALADAPGNPEATAGLGALQGPPARPTFQEPTLEALRPPTGVSDLDHLSQDSPQPFCSQKERNDYLTGEVSSLTDTLNQNMSTLALYSASLEATRAQYDANPLLRYAEKIEYLGLFDAEIKSIRDRHEKLAAWGYAVLSFFNRIKSDPKLIAICPATPKS